MANFKCVDAKCAISKPHDRHFEHEVLLDRSQRLVRLFTILASIMDNARYWMLTDLSSSSWVISCYVIDYLGK